MNRKYLLFFICMLLFIGIFAVVTFDGFFFYDDMMYMQYAYDLVHGTYKVSDQLHSNRFAVFLPVAFFYSLFGVNDFSSLAWPFLSVLCTIAVLYFAFRKEDPVAGMFAIVLTGLDFYTLYFSNKLYPDDIVTPFSLLSLVLLYKYRSSPKLIYPFAFVLSALTGFLVKTTIIYTFVFFLIVFCIDLAGKRNLRFWLVSALSGFLIVVVYFLIYKAYTGKYLYYLDSIETGHNHSPWSYYGKPFSEILYRITAEPFLMMLSAGYMIPILLALPVSYGRRWKEIYDLRKRDSFWLVCGTVMLLMFWFSSTSLAYYSPIPAYPRMMLLCIPVFSVAASFNLQRCLLEKKYNMIFGLLFLAAALLSYFFADRKISLIYLILGTVFLFFFFTWAYVVRTRFTTFFFTMLIVLLVHPLVSVFNQRSDTFFGEKKIITKNLQVGKGKALVITDYRLANSYVYYYRFSPPANYRFVSYPSVKKGELNSYRGTIYVIVNHNTDEYTMLYGGGYKIPDFIPAVPSGWKRIACENKVCLYQVADINDVVKCF
ncbi:MAG: ArnT family glycosyltransferase [Cytophagaceae bacterium]